MRKSIKFPFQHRSERVLEILMYIKLVAVLYRWLLCKSKKE